MALTPYLIFGTGNRNKGIETTRVIAPSGVRLVTLADVPNAIDVVEDGSTFGENARKKACEQARHLREWTLAEDSGICVDYLDGAPGVHSARFALMDRCDNKRNNQLLLEKLEGVPVEKRTAYYACHMVLSDPKVDVKFEVEEYCCGTILFEETGNGGFGYDPLFRPNGYSETFGILSPEIKARISHRAKATRILVPYLVDLVADGTLPMKQFD